MPKYSLKIGILKGVKYFVIFALPFLVNQFIVAYPQVAQISIGSLLVMIVNFLKVKAQKS